MCPLGRRQPEERVELPGRRWTVCVYGNEEGGWDVLTSGLARMGLPELFLGPARGHREIVAREAARFLDVAALELLSYAKIFPGLQVPICGPTGQIIMFTLVEGDVPEWVHCLTGKVMEISVEDGWPWNMGS
jgi:hypothetical protein